MGQVSFVPNLYFPSFQCSSVFKPADDIILGCFWDVFSKTPPYVVKFDGNIDQ